MDIHEKYMRLAIKLAKKAEGRTSPNPIVGAVIVKAGKVVGRGYHEKAGCDHAEIVALKEAREKAKGSTLFVTLEPCDHYGKTPPCSNAITKSGVKRVVIGMTDPNPINNGRGVKKLRKNGVLAIVGILEEEIRAINKPYIKFITKKMPYVTVKAAQSLDGKIATARGESKWITSTKSRHYVQKLRSKVDAVMVGVNTVINDDPSLMSKINGSRQPIRIIIDSSLRTPVNSKIFSRIKESPVIIATSSASQKTKRYEALGAEVIVVGRKRGGVDLKVLLRILASKDMTHVLVEGGGELIGSLIEEKVVDKILFFIAPKILGGRSSITSVEGNGITKLDEASVLKNVSITKFGDDILIEGEVRYSN